MDYQSKNHAKFLILYHLIFVCKYRKKLLISYGNEVKQLFEEIAARSDFSFETFEVDQDHIHCLVKSEPRISPLAIVRKLKQESTIQLWQRHEKELKSTSGRKGHFGVMAISAAPLEMQAKKPSASISKVKGEVRRSSTRLKTSWFSHRAYIKRRGLRRRLWSMKLLHPRR